MEMHHLKRLCSALVAAVFMATLTAIFTAWQYGSVLWLATFYAGIGTFFAWAIVLPLVERIGGVKGQA